MMLGSSHGSARTPASSASACCVPPSKAPLSPPATSRPRSSTARPTTSSSAGDSPWSAGSPRPTPPARWRRSTSCVVRRPVRRRGGGRRRSVCGWAFGTRSPTPDATSQLSSLRSSTATTSASPTKCRRSSDAVVSPTCSPSRARTSRSSWRWCCCWHGRWARRVAPSSCSAWCPWPGSCCWPDPTRAWSGQPRWGSSASPRSASAAEAASGRCRWRSWRCCSSTRGCLAPSDSCCRCVRRPGSCSPRRRSRVGWSAGCRGGARSPSQCRSPPSSPARRRSRPSRAKCRWWRSSRTSWPDRWSRLRRWRASPAGYSTWSAHRSRGSQAPLRGGASA